jgi:hypothetical protein
MKSHKQFYPCPLCKNYPEIYDAIVDDTLSIVKVAESRRIYKKSLPNSDAPGKAA